MDVCTTHYGIVMKMDGVKHDSQIYREDLISEFIRHCSDLVPYGPDYEETLLKMAENYADSVMDPNSEYNRKLQELDQAIDDGPIEIPF